MHSQHKHVEIFLNRVLLDGELTLPPSAHGFVLFAHGSGSSRLSPRNAFVARRLNDWGFGTLLFDLLTAREDQDSGNRFNIDLLTQRLIDVTDWIRAEPGYQHIPLGYFGASTGAAAALKAAAFLRPTIKAVVSRGGRPDLARSQLASVACPTLLIVGGADPEVIQLNRWALAQLSCERRLEIIPGATHLFEEPGALEAVADAAAGWFTMHLEIPRIMAGGSPR